MKKETFGNTSMPSQPRKTSKVRTMTLHHQSKNSGSMQQSCIYSVTGIDAKDTPTTFTTLGQCKVMGLINRCGWFRTRQWH